MSGADPLYIRLRLDFDRSHFWAGLRALASREPWQRAALRAERAWAASDDTVVCLCVRSAFDLVLSALALPRGSEVLISAITIPDMVRVLHLHGLVPVPIDLDAATLSPRMDVLERAIGPRTRAILVAHLFGGRVDMAPIAQWAKQRDLLVLEDAAQAVVRVGDGSPWADATMFSFGPLKTATALGGAILRLPDSSLRERARAIHERWPVQNVSTFRSRLAKIGMLTAIQEPRRVRVGARIVMGLGFASSLDELIRRGTRSFRPTSAEELARTLRARPPVPMLALLAHRLERFDESAIARRAEAGEATLRALGPGVRVAGARQPQRTHWFFGVEQDDPERTIARLLTHGVDAVWKLENLCVVEPSASRPDIVPIESQRLLQRCLFVPVYPQLDDAARARMVEVLRQGAPSHATVAGDWASCAL